MESVSAQLPLLSGVINYLPRVNIFAREWEWLSKDIMGGFVKNKVEKPVTCVLHCINSDKK